MNSVVMRTQLLRVRGVRKGTAHTVAILRLTNQLHPLSDSLVFTARPNRLGSACLPPRMADPLENWRLSQAFAASRGLGAPAHDNKTPISVWKSQASGLTVILCSPGPAAIPSATVVVRTEASGADRDSGWVPKFVTALDC